MKILVALMVCLGIGYVAEVFFENPQPYVVWVGFTFMTFAAYIYITQITSFAFALPVTIAFVGSTSAAAYIKGEPGFIIFGVYGAIAALILLGNRFYSWAWADWKYPTKFTEALSAHSRKNN